MASFTWASRRLVSKKNEYLALTARKAIDVLGEPQERGPTVSKSIGDIRKNSKKER